MSAFSRGSPAGSVPGRATRLTGCDRRPHTGGRGAGITISMPRSAAQSDFVVVQRPPEPYDFPAGPIGEATDPVELPRATLRSPEASARATRLVMAFTFLVLAALALLTMIGPHVPPE
jgi:hypothetical protein